MAEIGCKEGSKESKQWVRAQCREEKYQRNAKMQFKSTNENVTTKGSYALFLAVLNASLSVSTR